MIPKRIENKLKKLAKLQRDFIALADDIEQEFEISEVTNRDGWTFSMVLTDGYRFSSPEMKTLLKEFLKLKVEHVKTKSSCVS